MPLASRGEYLPALVVSVPISARTEATTGDLGNQVGVMPVAVPLIGPLSERLAHVARTTAGQKGITRGSSAARVDPVFRALAALGVFGWAIDRQRLVNTFLTNLRGPAQPVTCPGSTIESIATITVTADNVTTAFAALSYAGTLTISIITDPDHVPDHHSSPTPCPTTSTRSPTDTIARSENAVTSPAALETRAVRRRWWRPVRDRRSLRTIRDLLPAGSGPGRPVALCGQVREASR